MAYHEQTAGRYSDRERRLNRDIETLEARIAELENALRPFAKEAGEWGDLVPDDHYPVFVEMGHWDARYYGSKAKYSVGDQRHARRVLNGRAP